MKIGYIWKSTIHSTWQLFQQIWTAAVMIMIAMTTMNNNSKMWSSVVEDSAFYIWAHIVHITVSYYSTFFTVCDVFTLLNGSYIEAAAPPTLYTSWPIHIYMSFCICQGGLSSARPQERFIELPWEIIVRGTQPAPECGLCLRYKFSQLLNEGRG